MINRQKLDNEARKNRNKNNENKSTIKIKSVGILTPEKFKVMMIGVYFSLIESKISKSFDKVVTIHTDDYTQKSLETIRNCEKQTGIRINLYVEERLINHRN